MRFYMRKNTLSQRLFAMYLNFTSLTFKHPLMTDLNPYYYYYLLILRVRVI